MKPGKANGRDRVRLCPEGIGLSMLKTPFRAAEANALRKQPYRRGVEEREVKG